MAKVHEEITEELREWIMQQRIFFVATAPLSGDGHVNTSPKGMDCLRVLDNHTVAYLDMTGSGNETSAHLAETGNGRITMMWCAFEGTPRILRLYGRGRLVLPTDPDWAALSSQFPDLPGARQIIINEVNRVQTSCGTGVPLFDYVEDRDALAQTWISRGPENTTKYQQRKNVVSIDGLPTPLAKNS
jgi:hypothetical protein